MQLNERIFREYDIRGIADRDLSNPGVTLIGKAIGTYLKERGAKSISVGRDCRVSSLRIRNALVEGLLSTGVDVVDIGLVPTPLLYFDVLHHKRDGGVMITGSHNPPEHNGFKVSGPKTTLHGAEIQEVKQIAQSEKFAKGKGTLSETNIVETYLGYVVDNIAHPLDIDVVVDSGNGMGGMVAPELYRRLGCRVTEMYSDLDGTFPHHHPDPTVLENLKPLIQKVKELNSLVGIGFDGDADRIGAVDRTGRAFFGDELLVLYARDVLKKQPGAKVISEVKASHRLFQDVEKHGGVGILWKTGHSLIKAKMKEEGALVAGEMSGHMFFNDRYYGYDDAIYAGARLLELLAAAQKTPSELLQDLPHSHATPEIRVDCPDEVKFKVVEKALADFQNMGLKINTIDGARVEFGDGWGLVRASNTQPVLVFRFEANTEPRLQEIRGIIEGTVTKHIPRSR